MVTAMIAHNSADPPTRGSIAQRPLWKFPGANAPRARYHFADPVHRLRKSTDAEIGPHASEVAPAGLSYGRCTVRHSPPSRNWIPSAHLAISEGRDSRNF